MSATPKLNPVYHAWAKLINLPPAPSGHSYVVKVGNRYFCGWTKAGVVSTAWSIQGAFRHGAFYGDGFAINAATHPTSKRKLPRLGFTAVLVRFVEGAS